MANQLFNQMQGGNGINQFMQRLQQLKATGGDPNQRIQELLNSGKVTQQQYNAAVQRANAIRQMLGK